MLCTLHVTIATINKKCLWIKWLAASSLPRYKTLDQRHQSPTEFRQWGWGGDLTKLSRETWTLGSLLRAGSVTAVMVLIQKAEPRHSPCGREWAISTIDYCNVLGQRSPYCYHELRPIHLSYKNKKKINNNSNEPLIHMLASLERPTQAIELGANM